MKTRYNPALLLFVVSIVLAYAIASSVQAQTTQPVVAPATNILSAKSPAAPDIMPTANLGSCPNPNPSFYDVQPNPGDPNYTIYYEAITYMACRGYINGYPPAQCVGQGTPIPNGNCFLQNTPVRRGEYTRMLVGPFHWTYIIQNPPPPHFTDISGSLFYSSIEQGYAKGAISGYD